MGLATRSKPVSRGVLHRLSRFETAFTAVLDGADDRISGPSRTAIRAGGKRLRPALVIIAAGLGNAVDTAKLMSACAAVELVHLASLVHDDVLDDSNTRRGISTINADHGKRRAINIGDYLFGLAFDILAASHDNELAQPLAQASVELASGELAQRQTLRRLDQSVEAYLGKIYAKTAALFVASCLIGARLAGLGVKEEIALEQYAGGLGMAFQIYDDILDFTGDEASLGKPVGSDIREGTVTLPMIYALKEDADGILGAAIMEPDDGRVAAAVEFVNSSAAVRRAKEKAKEYVDLAKNAAGRLPDGGARKDLVSLGNFVIDRYH